MKISMKGRYEGELRCSMTHLASGETIITDAPTDNQGKGLAFSPTDLLCASLASCMLTIMGITAQTKQIPLAQVDVEIEKIMGSNPRRVMGITVVMKIVDAGLDEKSRNILENAALSCPVAKSLHPDIEQVVLFQYM